jgi:predicted adenylyl cyclase CyaB
MEECEVKFLNIDVDQITEKIEALGGIKQFDRMFKRIVFDYPDLRLNDQKHAWVRLRDEGDQVTLSYKQRLDVGDGVSNDRSMLENEVVVSDFEQTAAIMRNIGLADKFYEENRRIQYKLGDVELDIDYWPQLEPYLEIEASTWELVEETIEKLGLDPADKKIFSTHQIYAQAGINENEYKRITFDEMVKR